MGKLGVKFNKNVFDAGRQKMEEKGDYNDVELPPGRYVCVVKKARAQDVKGVAKVIFDLTVAGEAEQAGGRISIWHELSEEKTHYLMKTLDRLGYDVTDLDEDKLAEILADIEANPKVVRVTAKSAGEYTNYYIDKVLDDLSVADATGGEGESAADPEAAGGKAGVKADAHAKAGGKKKVEPEPEPEPEPEAEPEADELTELDREALKKIAKVEIPDFKVFKNTEDDAIRAAIRTSRAAAAPEPEAEPEPEPEAEEVELKVGMKVTVTIRGKDIPGAVVKSIDEKAGKVKVLLPDKSLATVGSDQISA